LTVAAQKSPLLVKKVSNPPIVDGDGGDKVWNGIAEHEILAGGKKSGSVKLCLDSERIYVLIKFPEKTERRKHGLWHWDPTLQIYYPGKEREAAASVVWTKNPVELSCGDLWIWRASRTDPSGVADDCHFAKKASSFNFFADLGVNSWQSHYFAEFAGLEIERFYQRKPSGSAADVKAKGKWEKGFWTVEFSRKLKTGNDDDIDFVPGKVFCALFAAGLPDANLLNNARLFFSIALELKGHDEDR